jgi:hypothetical protein
MVRAALLLVAALAATAAGAQSFPPERWTLRALPEATPAPIHAREMLIVTLRGDYGDHIALEELTVPPVDGLSWVQLGHDRWFEEYVDGLPHRVFERRLALWPEEDGTVALPALTHRFTLSPRGSVRRSFDVASEPLRFEVAPPLEEAGWWLPARALTVEEEWTGGDALNLRPGEALTRTVRLTAAGVTPDRIGPQPSLDTDTVFAFPEPETREMAITPEGPVSRVTWRWSILPDTPRPTAVPPVTIRWFDTVAREMRAIDLPAKPIAVAEDVFGVRRERSILDALAPLAAPGGLAAGLAAGLALAFRGLRPRALADRLAAPLRRLRLRRALRRAAVRGDAFAARRAARALAGDPADPALAALDRLAYGPGAAAPAAVRAAAAALLARDPAK